VDVRFEHETVWLTQAQMVELFHRDVSVISRHIKNAVQEGEINEKSNLQKMQIAVPTSRLPSMISIRNLKTLEEAHGQPNQ
jgi:hypothetical protein